jgi:hypothetical protein
LQRRLAGRARRITLGATVTTLAVLGVPGSGLAHPFTWDRTAADPSRPGVTIRWDRSIAGCGDTTPFRPFSVRAHQGQQPIRSDEYMVVSGRRQVRSGARWVSLPGPADEVEKRAANGRATAHFTLAYYLRSVDKGKRSRVKLRYLWKRAGGEPGDADDEVFARRNAYTRACTIP